MTRRRHRTLLAALLTLISLQVVHTVDHLARQSVEVPAEVKPLGILGFVSSAAALALVLRDDRLAPVAVAIAGLGVALGFIAVHVAPDWGPFSQPYGDIEVDGLSWAAMFVPAATGALVGLLGVRAARA